MDTQALFEGIRERHMGDSRKKLVTKWTKTNLLKGLSETRKQDMAQLLENQAAWILKEAASLSTGGGAVTSSGQIQGYSNIAFPIVRRVFGGLVANEIVSVQPMHQPNGLIFYLDYSYGSNVGGNAGFGLSNSATLSTYKRGQSLFGNPVGKAVQFGANAAGGMYDIVGGGYSRVHQSSLALSASNADVGAFVGAAAAWTAGGVVTTNLMFTGSNARFAGFDPQIESDLAAGTLDIAFAHIPVSTITSAIPAADLTAVDQLAVFGFSNNSGSVAWGDTYQGGQGVLNLRKYNKRGNWSGTSFTPDPYNGTHVQVVLRLTNGTAVPSVATAALTASVAIRDSLSVDSGTGATTAIPSFETDFGATPSPAIPEVDIKIESIAITAEPKKLRARWSPELAQDLNAYHSMDAEVELTQILSQQIALEIDREILLELVTGATGDNRFWSRAPGKVVNAQTGEPTNLANSLSVGPQFYGNQREWYETLIEQCTAVGNTILRKTLRGQANFMVVGPDVATILEHSVQYRPSISMDSDGQTAAVFQIGAEKVGTLSNRYTVYKDPYFPVNKILIGFKGGSALETGYVYAPYVPLIVTQTVYAPEDFSPRRGVMTRFGKKMIRADFYGTVTVLDMGLSV